MSDRYFGFFNQSGVTNTDVDAYFTRASFVSMFGDEASAITDAQIAGAADAARDVSIPGVYLALPGLVCRHSRPVLLAHEYEAGAEYSRYADDTTSAIARAQEQYDAEGQAGIDAADVLEYFCVPSVKEVRSRYLSYFSSESDAIEWAGNAASVGSEFLKVEPGETVEWYQFLLSQLEQLDGEGEWV